MLFPRANRFVFSFSNREAIRYCFSQRGSQAVLKRLLVVLRLNVPVNNFSVMSGRSHRFLGN